MLDGLLSYARPRDPQKQPLPAGEVLQRVVTLTGRSAQSAGVRTLVADGRDVVIHADPGHVQQILMNLVLNALQAMPDGGTLQLRARREDGFGVLAVTDTGPGIAPEHLDKVLEPFFTTKARGTGLNLNRQTWPPLAMHSW